MQNKRKLIYENVLIFPRALLHIESEWNMFKVNGNGRQLFSYKGIEKFIILTTNERKNFLKTKQNPSQI